MSKRIESFLLQTLGLHNGSNSHTLRSKRHISAKISEPQKTTPAQTILSKTPLPWLRDTCNCLRCLDKSTGQKLFQTCDIPAKIEARILQETDKAFKVAWQNDVPGSDPQHISTYSKKDLWPWLNPPSPLFTPFATATPNSPISPWPNYPPSHLKTPTPYADYLSSATALRSVLFHLKTHGLVLLNNVPKSEDAVSRIASRIGPLRETFYGTTWDVRSVPNAKNVAYTNQHLGFHMDLLYMREPPGLQLLHCRSNSCKGGESLFADGFAAALSMKEDATTTQDIGREQRAVGKVHDDGEENEEQEVKSDFKILTSFQQVFHYCNAGHHYRFKRPMIQLDANNCIEAVNWSPPFQAPFERSAETYRTFGRWVRAARRFAEKFDDPRNRVEMRLGEGECVIFDNRRIVHGRRGFDTSAGERWLRGAYVDTDVFESRCRVLLGEGSENGFL